VEYAVQPFEKVFGGTDGVIPAQAVACLADPVHGVDAPGAAQIGRIGEPHCRGGVAAVQQHQRFSVLGAARCDPGGAVRRRQVHPIDGYGPAVEDGVVGRQKTSQVFCHGDLHRD
jgi:hypothetical protein